MAGLNRDTGKLLDGWPHVVQSLMVIFTTGFGTRVMRRWFGSSVPQLLGESIVPSTVVRFYGAVATAIELWEPRFRVTKVTPLAAAPEATRGGLLGLRIDGEYRPRGHLGDFTPDGMRTVHVDWRGGRFLVVPGQQ